MEGRPLATMAVGASTRLDPTAAANEAVAAARAGAPAPVFALVLATEPHEPAALATAMTNALGDVPWAGGRASGVLVGTKLLDPGLVVALFSGAGARVGVGVADAVAAGPRTAGALATRRALAGLPAAAPQGGSRALLLLADAFAGGTADVVRGAQEVAGTGVIWAGGGTADRQGRGPGALFAGGRAHLDSVVVVALDWPARAAASLQHGFVPYGPPTLVTRTQGTSAVELEYESAFRVYQRTARDRGQLVTPETFASFAVTHPLGVPRADGAHVIHDPMGLDPDGGLRCLGEVPDGCLMRVMEGSPARLLAAARLAVAEARQGVGGPLAGTLVFDCLSRHQMLGAGFADELGIFAGAGDEAGPVLGCLTFGEIGALGRGGPQFHNKTAVVLALGRP